MDLSSGIAGLKGAGPQAEAARGQGAYLYAAMVRSTVLHLRWWQT